MTTPTTIRCCICTNPVPEERATRKGVTCSKACAKALKSARRGRHATSKCRLCGRPGSPEEWKLFKRWRAETFPKKKAGRPRVVKPEKPVQEEFTEMISV